MKRRGIKVFIEYQSVLLSELGPLTRKRVCLPHWIQRGEQHSLAGEREGEGTQFERLDKKPGTLYTLWDEVKR